MCCCNNRCNVSCGCTVDAVVPGAADGAEIVILPAGCGCGNNNSSCGCEK